MIYKQDWEAKVKESEIRRKNDEDQNSETLISCDEEDN